jgi:opacity protein-like surface antigen
MKILTLIGFVLLSVSTVKAEDSPYYIKAEAGPAFLQDIHVRMHLAGVSNNDLKAKTGARVDLIGGYNFNDYLAGELDIAMVRNELVDIGHTIYYQVPVMANVVGKYPMGKWQPYAGVGLGLVASIPDNHGQGSDDVDEVFGTQAMAGIKYQFTRDVSLDLGYKFLYTATAQPAPHITLGPGYTHSLLLGIAYRF